MSANRDLEDRFLWVVRAMVVVGALALAAGLLMHLAWSDKTVASAYLRAGLVLLMATPALRIVIAVAERLRRRDFQFVLVTAVVVLELSLTMWYATTRV